MPRLRPERLFELARRFFGELGAQWPSAPPPEEIVEELVPFRDDPRATRTRRVGARVLAILLLACACSCAGVPVRVTNATSERLGLEVVTFDAAGRPVATQGLRGVAAGATVTRRIAGPPGGRFQLEAYTGQFVKVKYWKSAPTSAAGARPEFVVRPDDLTRNTFYLPLGPR